MAELKLSVTPDIIEALLEARALLEANLAPVEESLSGFPTGWLYRYYWHRRANRALFRFMSDDYSRFAVVDGVSV